MVESFESYCDELSNPREVAKNYPLYRNWQSNFAYEECNIISQTNSAAEWNFATFSTYASRTESKVKPVDQSL